MTPELVLSGEGDVRSVSLLGREVGEGRRQADGRWRFGVDAPGWLEGVHVGGDDLETAWDDVRRYAAPELARTAERLARLETWRSRIAEQAGEDWMPLAVDPLVAPSGVLQVPRLPFVRWALRDANRHLWPEWTNVCPSGLKIRGDDRNHSDWMVGAGLDPAFFYSVVGRPGSQESLLNKAAYDAMLDLQFELLSFECAVLSGAGRFVGKAWHPDRNPGEAPPPDRVIVLPDASMRWTDLLVAAGRAGQAVIVEVGGAGAHLASLGREQGVRMVRVPEARRLYPDRWTELTVDCDRGVVRITGE